MQTHSLFPPLTRLSFASLCPPLTLHSLLPSPFALSSSDPPSLPLPPSPAFALFSSPPSLSPPPTRLSPASLRPLLTLRSLLPSSFTLSSSDPPPLFSSSVSLFIKLFCGFNLREFKRMEGTTPPRGATCWSTGGMTTGGCAEGILRDRARKKGDGDGDVAENEGDEEELGGDERGEEVGQRERAAKGGGGGGGGSEEEKAKGEGERVQQIGRVIREREHGLHREVEAEWSEEREGCDGDGRWLGSSCSSVRKRKKANRFARIM